MSKFKAKNFSNSAYYAIRGLKLALRTQKNVRIHFLIALTMFFISYLFNVNLHSFAIIILSNALVISLELFNSVIEFALDAYFKNKYSTLVKMAKDIAAGCVLFMSCINVFVFFLIIAEKIFFS